MILRNTDKDKRGSFTKKIVDYLTERGGECFVSDDGMEVTEDVDCVVVLGGDGTLLHTANQVAGLGLPVLGINIGRIGYMAELESNEIDILKNIIDGNFQVEERMRLDVSVLRGDKVVYRKTALNDAVIMKTGLLWIIDLDIFADEMFISRYSGDGVLVATPTGSTAYSLSAGGPIIDPVSKNITITPVCAHALTAKPIVLCNNRKIKIVSASPENSAVAISVDGEDGFELMHGDEIIIALHLSYFLRNNIPPAPAGRLAHIPWHKLPARRDMPEYRKLLPAVQFSDRGSSPDHPDGL